MPEAYGQALELARQRAEGEIDAARFASRADWLLGQMPVAATVIGLKHGAPNAMRLLAIAAALNAGPLTAALQSSRNHRGYERLRARRELREGESRAGSAAVAIGTARLVFAEAVPSSLSEARCAERQLEAWRRL